MNIKQLMAHHAQAGIIRWIGVRPQRQATLRVLDSVRADPANGLEGDHYAGRINRQRQVTLIQHEHLAVIAALLGKPIDPTVLRRNLVLSGINLLALRGQTIRAGSVLLKVTGFCHPCSRMETALGAGGYNAVRGHGGVTAEILRGGVMALGDPVLPVPEDRLDAFDVADR